jgi:hypothetical protein
MAVAGQIPRLAIVNRCEIRREPGLAARELGMGGNEPKAPSLAIHSSRHHHGCRQISQAQQYELM